MQQSIKDSFKKEKEKKNGWDKNDPWSIRITHFICEFIALGCHSFSIVDEQGFVRLLKELRPEYPLQGRKVKIINHILLVLSSVFGSEFGSGSGTEWKFGSDSVRLTKTGSGQP